MLYRRGNIWWVKFERNGAVVRVSTHCANRREAEATARRLRVAFDSQPHTQRQRPGPCGVTLETLEALDIARAEDEGLKENSQQAVREKWKPLLRLLGARHQVSAMTVGDVLAYVGARRKEGARGQTIRKEVQALTRCLRIAKRDRMIGTLPFDPEDVPTIRSDPKLACQAGKLWTEDQINSVFSNFSTKALTAGHLDRCRLVMLTGLRFEELHRVLPEWVTEMIPIGSVCGMLDLPDSAAKWSGGRKLPLTGEALEICKRCLPFQRKKPNKSLALASKAAKLPGVLTPRDLRTWFLTQSGQQDVTQARDLAGHTDVKTTSIYLRGTETRAIAAIELVAQKYALVGTVGRHIPSNVVKIQAKKSK